MTQNPNVNKLWRLRNPKAVRAHTIVNWEIRCGRISKQPCEICGKLKAHAHHDDYGKPLELHWLCDYHHRKLHQPNAPKGYVPHPRQYPKHKLIEQATTLRAQGKTYKSIAIALGVSIGSVYKWLNDTPYH